MFKRSLSPAAEAAALRAAERAERRRAEERAERPVDWQAVRSAERPQDKALAPYAVKWCQALSADVRPVALESAFPRIVNRLALCWQDAGLCAEVFESLLNDKRPNRKGFPQPIRRELEALRQYRRSLSSKSAGPAKPAAARPLLELAPRFGAWDLHMQAVGDR